MLQDTNTPIREFLGIVWRLALYFFILITSFLLLSKAYGSAIDALRIHWARAPNVVPAEAVLFGQIRLLIAALLAWQITARVGGDQLPPILPFRWSTIGHLAQGTLWGSAAMAATIGLIAAFGGYQVSGIALSGVALAYYVPLWLLIAFVNGVAENLALLGYPLFRIARSAGWLPAMIITSVLFAVAHFGNPGENPLGLISIFVTVLAFGVAVWATGNLWLSAGIHAGIIITEDLVFSLPDSGQNYTGHLLASRLTGPTWLSGGEGGPEATVFALVAFAILLLLLWLVYRRPGAQT
jgi:membrane protease YdiL (CAAX protease family)